MAGKKPAIEIDSRAGWSATSKLQNKKQAFDMSRLLMHKVSPELTAGIQTCYRHGSV